MSLREIHIQGFKSIRDQKLLFGPLNVFIGGNGSGKSNLVGVFHFLNRIANQQLQTYTGEAGEQMLCSILDGSELRRWVYV